MAKIKPRRGAHFDYLARMQQTLPAKPVEPEPEPAAVITVAPPVSNPLDTAPVEPGQALHEPGRSIHPALREPLFRTCERCGAKRAFIDVGPSKQLCRACWAERNGQPVFRADNPARNPYFRLRMSVEEAFISLRNGRYAAALSVLERARLEHTPIQKDQT